VRLPPVVLFKKKLRRHRFLLSPNLWTFKRSPGIDSKESIPHRFQGIDSASIPRNRFRQSM